MDYINFYLGGISIVAVYNLPPPPQLLCDGSSTVERLLPKQKVAGSIPVHRFQKSNCYGGQAIKTFTKLLSIPWPPKLKRRRPVSR